MDKKFIRLIFAAAMLLFAHSSWAYDFSAESNGTTFYYNITSNTAPYTVEVTYATSNYSSYWGSVTIPASVTYNGITYSVTSIGQNAFSSCFGLASITIPNSITNIGQNAFSSCIGLASITIPNSVKTIGILAFENTGLTRTNFTGTIAQWCKINFGSAHANPIEFSHNLYINNQLVTNLVIPNTVDTIKPYAFCGDTCITSVTIGNSVTNIGNYAFEDCRGLTSVTIPDSVRNIGIAAFGGCTGLTSVTIGNSVRSIGDYAFYGDTNLVTINFNADSCVYVYNYDFDYDYVFSVFSDCNNLRTLNIGNNVKFIPKYAFKDCRGLTSVTIGNSVRSIGDSAFTGCRSLATINFNADSCLYVYNNNSVFSGCNNLRTLNIGNNVKLIPNYAFKNCRGLTSVTIGDSVTNIGNNAFGGCTGLTRTNYTGTIAQWCKINFGNASANPIEFSHNLYINNQLLTNLIIPNTVKAIKHFAFCGDTCITSVTIGDSVTNIGNNAFGGCTGLTRTNYTGTIAQWCKINFGNAYANPIEFSHNLYINNQLVTNLVIPNTVDTIKPYAFCGDTCITSAFIPNSVTCIGDLAFDSCTNLTSVTIPNSVTSIGYWAFAYCTNLTSVTIGNSVRSIGHVAFYGDTNLVTINYNADSCVFDVYYHDEYNHRYYYTVFYGCNNIRTLNIGNNVKFIPNYAFYGCTGLTSVSIPDSVKTIGNHAFEGCRGLTSVTIPDSITIIGNSAFCACSGLTSVTIGNSVTSIGDDAFLGCTGLTRTNFTGTIAQWCDIDFYVSVSVNSSNTTNPIIYSHNLYINNQLVTNLVIPNTVDTIKPYAFCGDTCITTVTIGDSVTSIGQSALAYCTGLTSATFRRNNTTIGSGSFYNVPAGAQIHIPCGSSAWYRSRLNGFSNFIEESLYTYTVSSQDTAKGTVATVTAPTCNTPLWTISATANNGYFFSHWSDGDTLNPRTLTVTQDTTMVAYFTQWYRFSAVSEDTAKGSVQIITQPTQANPQAIIMATANNGYTFSRWSDGNTQNPRSLTVTQDTALVAYFRGYNFNVVSEDTIKGTVQILTQPSQNNPQVTFIALPNTGYTFSHWSDGNTQNPRTITVTQDTALVAYFTGNSPQYSFILFSEDTNKGRVQILSQNQQNNQVSFEALPNNGYSFILWSDGNTQNPRSMTLTQNTSLIAHFSNDTPHTWGNFNAMSEDTTRGSVQLVEQNGRATLTATPQQGYEFSHWSDGDTTNPRIISNAQRTAMLKEAKGENVILIAHFEPVQSQGMTVAENAYIKLYPNPASDMVTLDGVGNEAKMLVINAVGKIMKHLDNVSGTVNFSVADLPKGIYFVRVGNTIRKLVVE